ncbi:MAG: MarR family transcriptional regulator [Beijerinckiaceae bacterium]
MTAQALARGARRKRGGPPATAEDLRAYIPYLVNRLSNRLTIDQGRMLADHGLSNAALRILSVLHIYRRLTVNEISVVAVLEQSSASRTIDSMLAAGLVTRESGARDSRRREVAPTDAGEQLLGEVWPHVAQGYARLTEGIGAEDVATCARVLSRMIDNVRQHDI